MNRFGVRPGPYPLLQLYPSFELSQPLEKVQTTLMIPLLPVDIEFNSQ